MHHQLQLFPQLIVNKLRKVHKLLLIYHLHLKYIALKYQIQLQLPPQSQSLLQHWFLRNLLGILLLIHKALAMNNYSQHLFRF